jgi:hypothetical protein
LTLDHPADSLQGGKPAALCWRASCSGRLECDVDEPGGRFAVLEAFGNDAERKGLDASHRLITILPVAQHAGQSGNLGDPATVFFAFELDREGHPRNVPSGPASTKSRFLVAVSYATRGTKGEQGPREVFRLLALSRVWPARLNVVALTLRTTP